MAAVLYLLGVISIVLGAIVAADRFIDTYSLGLSVSVAYQAVVGGVLLFVMARLLQHAAATARNTEKFYQQVLQNPGAAAAMTAATTAVAKEVKAEPKVEAPAKVEPAPAKPAEPEPAPAPVAAEAKQEPTLDTAAAAPAVAAEPAAAVEAVAEEVAVEAPAVDSEAEPTIVEQLEYRGYMIDKLSNGKVDVHTAEGPMQFDSLEVFQSELEQSNG